MQQQIFFALQMKDAKQISSAALKDPEGISTQKEIREDFRRAQFSLRVEKSAGFFHALK